jgi:hypothetical protein
MQGGDFNPFLTYRISQKEVPHFKCLFYKNNKNKKKKKKNKKNKKKKKKKKKK